MTDIKELEKLRDDVQKVYTAIDNVFKTADALYESGDIDIEDIVFELRIASRATDGLNHVVNYTIKRSQG